MRISSCCLTRTDSATTARAPPGPASRATVATRWRNRTARSRLAPIVTSWRNPRNAKEFGIRHAHVRLRGAAARAPPTSIQRVSCSCWHRLTRHRRRALTVLRSMDGFWRTTPAARLGAPSCRHHRLHARPRLRWSGPADPCRDHAANHSGGLPRSRESSRRLIRDKERRPAKLSIGTLGHYGLQV